MKNIFGLLSEWVDKFISQIVFDMLGYFLKEEIIVQMRLISLKQNWLVLINKTVLCCLSLSLTHTHTQQEKQVQRIEKYQKQVTEELQSLEQVGKERLSDTYSTKFAIKLAFISILLLYIT